MSFSRLSDILEITKERHIKFWEVILKDDMQERNVSREESFETMRKMYREMHDADARYDSSLRSVSGMAGGDGEKIHAFRERQVSLAGDFLTEVMEKAIKMGESNACMRRIVAAPTAGSCGVIPAVLLTYEEQFSVSEDRMIEALFVAAGIGEVIAESASIAGAEGGCQAEIGTASAMASGALRYLTGGSDEEITEAAALAIKNMLGLTCDPVAGLVEVPCVKRNASGAVNAVITAELVRAGLSSRIPPDEVIDSMRRTGKLIPGCLRETGQEGLATTETGLHVLKELKGKSE